MVAAVVVPEPSADVPRDPAGPPVMGADATWGSRHRYPSGPGASDATRLATGTPRLDVLVLDGGSRQSLVTVRSLGRRGLSVGALETYPGAPAFASRWCKARFVCPEGYATDAYLRALEEARDRTDASLAIPAHDGTIALLRQQRDRVERRVRIALATEAALAVAVSKPRTLALAAELGIPTPASFRITAQEHLPEALEMVGLPAVVKPAESWVGPPGRGARLVPRLVTSMPEAERVVADVTRLGGEVLLQSYVGGRREAVSLLYADGIVHARFAQWAQRTVPPLGGDSVLRQSIPVPADLGEASERLVRAMDLEGYSEVEFRRDSAGVPQLMEINPRLSASVEIAVRSGVDFPILIKQWALGEPIARVERYRTGGWMRYLGGDVRGTLEAIRQRGRPGIPTPARAVRDFTTAFFHPAGYDYLEWRDPLPALRATAGFVRQAVSQILKGGTAPPRRSSHGHPGEGDAPTAHAPRTT